MDTLGLGFSLLTFPVMLVGMFFFVAWVISNFGWARLAARYETADAPPPEAEQLNGQTIALGWLANYKGIMRAAITHDALWLRPGFMFHMFHPQLRIPLSEIERVEGRATFITAAQIHLRGDMPMIRAYGRLGKAIAERAAPAGISPRTN